MAEEVLDQIVTDGPGPKAVLADEHRAKLDSIVQQMIKNKEPDSNIQMVVNDFKQKYSTGESALQQPRQEPQPFKSATDWLNISQGYQPLVKDNAVPLDAHTVKTGQAAERVREHLLDMDNSIGNLIHARKQDIQGRIVSEQLGLNPKETGPINPQAQQLSSKLKQDIPVDKSEIEGFKNAMGNDPLLARQGLAQKAKDLENSNPIKAKQLKGDIYRLDRQNNPEKDSKIEDNVKKIESGDYDYDVANGVLTKPVGFFGGIVEGFRQKNKAFNDYDVYSSGNEDEIIKHLNKKINGDPDEPTVVGTGGFANVLPGGEGGMAIGGQPLKPLAAGALASWAGGPGAGAASMSLVSGPEVYKLAFANALPENYAALKKQNPHLSDKEVYHKANELADKQATVEGATAIAMGALGGEFAFKPTGLGAGLLQKSVGSALKQIGEEGAKKALEGLGVGAIGGAGQVVRNLISQKAGLKTETDEGVIGQFKMGVGMTLGMTIAAKLPHLLNPKTYNQLFTAISSQPKEAVNAQINSLEQSGHITPEEAQNLKNGIQEHQVLNQSIKPYVPESDRIKVQELIKKRNELESSLETSDKAYHPDIKEEIKKINEQILNISKGNDRGELQKLVDQEHKSGNIEGFVTQTLRDASEGDLKRYFKEIAEQVHDPNSEATTIATFGENIVNKAKELFPKKEISSSEIELIESNRKEDLKLKDEEIANSKAYERDKLLKERENINRYYDNQISTLTNNLNKDGAGKVSAEQIGHVEVSEHGEDTKTAAGKENGVGPSPLTEEGMKEAKQLGQYVAENNKSKIITSEVERGLQTAEEAAKEAKKITGKEVTIERNELLNTANIGSDEGKPEGTFKEKEWFDGKYAPDGAESPDSFKVRMEKAYEYVKSLPDDAHVVSHSKVMRALDALSKTDGKWTDETTEIFLKNKELTHAIQEPSTSGVLQHSQEGTGAERSERGRVEPGQQGEVPTGTHPEEEGKNTGKEGIGEPPVSIPVGGSVHVEHPGTQLSFRGLQDTANEFGFEDVKSRDRVSDLQERKNAENEVNEWVSKGEYQENIDHLLTEIENRRLVPVARQRLILEQYLANEKHKARMMNKLSSEYDAQVAKIQYIKDVGTIARQEAGAALRLPDSGTLPHPILDESDAMIAKMKANAVDKLTDQQKAEVEAQVEEYRQRDEKANAKIAELEEKVAKLDAQKEFNKAKSTTKRTKKTASERMAFRRSEIEAAREALKKLRSGESGLSAVPLPGVRELMAIAPHVKNIMVDLVAQGVDNLHDVISNLHTEFKDVLDGLTEKNIHDIIAGEYNEPGRPISELQRQVKDLQDEAKLINQIEALENGVEPKTEKAKRERNQKIKALRDKIKELKATDGADELRAIKKRNEDQVKKINDKIAKGEFEKETKKSIFDREDVKQKHPQLRKEALDAIAKKEEAQHEFDLALFNDEMKRRKWYQKAGNAFGKVIHTSKAIMSGIDDSATFVQNGLALMANPKIGAKAFINHAKDAFSNARFKRELAALHQRPDWEIIKKSGLEIVEPHSAASKQVEEAFEQNLLANLEIKGVKPWDYTGGIFERAFTSMGNNMRLLLFEKRMEALKDAQMTFESHPQEYKDAARVINELTGRGKLPAGLAQASPYITPFIWAPRMLASTLNTLGIGEIRALGGKGYYQNLTPMQRRFALSQLGRGVGIGVAVMGAAALGGAKVDYDPRSVTFGDVIIGDHHYNVFGRYTPIVKVLVQAGMGTRIKGGGQEQDLDSGKFGAKTRTDVVYGFFRGKTTPALSTALNLAEHRNYFTNEPFSLKDIPGALLQPMSVKELRDGWKNDGSMTILNRFLPAFEGVKTSDERDFGKKGGSGGGAGATGTIGHKTTKHKASHSTHKTR